MPFSNLHLSTINLLQPLHRHVSSSSTHRSHHKLDLTVDRTCLAQHPSPIPGTRKAVGHEVIHKGIIITVIIINNLSKNAPSIHKNNWLVRSIPPLNTGYFPDAPIAGQVHQQVYMRCDFAPTIYFDRDMLRGIELRLLLRRPGLC